MQGLTGERLHGRLRWPARLAVLVLVLVQTVAFATPATAGTSPNFDQGLRAQLQAILDAVRADRPIVGLAATVILADGTRWEGGSGRADKDNATRLFRAGTPSVVGSITKTFIAALVLQLVEEGKLSLDDRLATWVPEKGFSPRIGLRHLLRHTSGLPDYFTAHSYKRLVFERPTHAWTRSEVLSLITPRLLFRPGAGWSYSNSNYFLLGLIVERATGSTVGELLRKRFIGPLGLADTRVQGEEALPANAAHGYLFEGGTMHGLGDGTNFRPNTSAATVAWSVGNIMSSAADIADWTRALYGGKVVSPASLALMTTFNASGYGMGTMVRDGGNGATAWGHNGSLRGYTAVTWYFPSEDLTVTVLTNRGRIGPDRISRELATAVLDWEPTPRPTPSPTPPTPSPTPPTPSPTPPTPSPTPPTPSPTPATPSPSPTISPSPTAEVTPSPTAEVTPTPEVTPSPTVEVTPSPTAEVTPTPEVTPTAESSPTPTVDASTSSLELAPGDR